MGNLAPNISFPALLLLVGLGTSFLLTTPFSPSRPESVIESIDSYGREMVPARLWQDPFEAVYSFIEKNQAESGHCIVNDKAQIEPRHHFNCLAKQMQAFQTDGHPVTVLAVMLPGSPYFEDKERRLRSRYATLAALSVEGYAPEDSAFIDYVSNVETKKNDIVLPKVLPYEWFNQVNPADQAKNPSSKLLLLWLDEAAFAQKPLQRLDKLIERLHGSGLSGVNYHFDFRLLGPFGSGTLQAISEETRGLTDADSPLSQAIVAISPSATVDRPVIGADIWPKDLFSPKQLKFLRTILPDKQHSRALVNELALRNVDITAKNPAENDHVVIISEWDTLYSRSLNSSFCAAIAELRSEQNDYDFQDQSDCYAGNDQHAWVHHFNYLRGIDGTVFSSKAVTTQNFLAGEDEQQTVDVERPIQNNQFDYIRRLATQISQLDHELKKQNHHKGIAAIGVMGNDVYDKLLILQALRQKFPGVLFFTVDLDARFIHPAEYTWTRNLIVASTYSLKWGSDIRNDVVNHETVNLPSSRNPFPMFRDSYQTSLFFSTQLILANSPEKLDQLGLTGSSIEQVSQKALNQLLATKIHEVSSTGFYKLHTQDNRKNIQTEIPGMIEQENSTAVLLGKVFLIFAISYALLYLISEKVNRWTHQRFASRQELWRFSLTAIATLLVLALLIDWLSAAMWAENGEPFELFLGISTWPTALIRTIAIFLAVYFYYSISVYELPEHRLQLQQNYIHNNSINIPRCRVCFLAIHRWRSKQQDQEIAVTELWGEYLARGHWLMRLSRTMVLMICYLAFLLSIVSFFELDVPNLPTRGPENTLYLQITLLLAIFTMLFVIFYTADANQLCRRFITILSNNKVGWPQQINGTNVAHIHDAQMDEDIRSLWLKLNLIADDTTLVSRMVYFPFFILFLMLFARLTIFDNWTTPPGLMLVLLLNFIFAFYSVSIMEKSANQARNDAVDWLSHKSILLQSLGRDKEQQQVDLISNYIQSIRKGAFQPFSERPLVRAAILPFATIGVTIFEYMTMFQY